MDKMVANIAHEPVTRHARASHP